MKKLYCGLLMIIYLISDQVRRTTYLRQVKPTDPTKTIG